MPPRFRPFRWLKRLAKLTVALVLLFAFALWLLTRSWFIVGRVTPLLEAKLGGDVSIDQAIFHWPGRYEVLGLTLAVPGLDGPEAEVLRVASTEVDLDMRSLLRGHLRIRDIRVHDARLRLAENANEPGVFNFMALAPSWDRAAARIELPPTISVDRATFETGHYFDEGSGTYEVTGARSLSGTLHDVNPGRGAFEFGLHEVDRRGSVIPAEDGGLRLLGEWNARTNEHRMTLTGLQLDRRAYNLCPRTQRIWWDRMGLEGQVGGISYEWTRENAYQIEFDIADVFLRVPIGAEAMWARYRNGAIESTDARPRMRVDKGTIRLERDRVALLGLEGELMPAADAIEGTVGVPYRVTVDINEIPPLAWEHRDVWMQNVLDTVPFRMSFATEDFHVQGVAGEGRPPVVLPLVVAQVLEKFRLSDWSLSTSVEITRDAPRIEPDGTRTARAIRMDGTARISEARGAYQVFPYPLREVRADLAFSSDVLMVRRLTGRGPTGAEIELSGTIAPPGPDPEVRLSLTARQVPVDEHLRTALTEEQRRVFDELFHASSLERLHAERLLPDDDPFRLGGMVDLELSIERNSGAGADTRLSGDIAIHELGLLYAGFPYPIAVDGGVIRWNGDALSVEGVDGGVPFRTYGGGQGLLSGSIALVRDDGETRVVPRLEVRLAGDRMNEALYAAVPEGDADVADDPDAPGKARGVELLRSIGLEGVIDCRALIDVDQDQRLRYVLDVALRDGRAEPGDAVSAFLGAGGILHPEQWVLEDLRGRLRVTADRVEIVEVSARHGHGALHASGAIDLAADEPHIRMDVVLEGTELGDYLVEMMPEAGGERVRAIWDRFLPSGRFDAVLRYERQGDRTLHAEVEVMPELVHVEVGGRPITLERRKGSILVSERTLAFADLELGVDEGDRDDGIIVLTGSLGLGQGDEGLVLEGAWSGGNFSSSLIPEALDLAGRDNELARWREAAPRGVFDASFAYVSPRGGARASYGAELNPREGLVTLTLRDTPVSIRLEPGTRVTVTPGRIEFVDLVGELVSGTARAAGVVDFGVGPAADETHAEIGFAYDGRVCNEVVESLLPPLVGRLFEAIELTEGGATGVENGRVVVDRRSDGIHVDFRGRFNAQGASCRTGVRFEQIDGPIDVAVVHRPGVAPSVLVSGELDRAVVLGQQLTDIELEVAVEDRKTAEIRKFHALARRGSLSVDGYVGIGKNREYAIYLRAAGVPLEDFELEHGDDEPANDPEAPDGRIFASLDLGGLRSAPETRVGRGSIRVDGDRLASVPFGLQIFQVLQLSLPGSHWNYADASFFLEGSRIVFERLLFEATFGVDVAQQQLIGAGDLDLDAMTFRARFRSRGSMPIIREIVGGIGDRLAAIEVSGPVGELESKLVLLPKESDPRAWVEGVAPRVEADAGGEAPEPQEDDRTAAEAVASAPERRDE